MVAPPPLPKEPFDPSPSYDSGAAPTPSVRARAMQGGIAIGKFGVIPLGVLYAAALLVKAIKPSWAGPIDDVLNFLKAQ